MIRTQPRHYLLLALLLIFVSVTAQALTADDAWLPQSRFPHIHALIESGNLEAAQAAVSEHLTGSDPLPAMLLQAELLEQQGQYQTAESIWNLVAQKQTALAGHAARKTVGLRLLQQDPAGADAALKKVPGGYGDRDNIHLLLAVADGYSGAGAYDTAVDMYRRVLRLRSTGYQADAARLGIGQARLKAGNEKGALDALRELQRNFRDATAFAEARRLERLAESTLGSVPKPFDEATYRRLIDRLKTRAAWNQALELFDEWATHFPESKQADQFEAELIDVLYRMRTNQEALARCLAFYTAWPKSNRLGFVRFRELLLYQRMGKSLELRMLAGQMWRGEVEVPASTRRNAGMVAASYLVSIGEVSEGLEWYRQVYRSGVSNATKNDILWRVGIGALRDGQLDRARANLRVLQQRRPRGDEYTAMLYWLARAENALGNRRTALGHLAELQARYPRDYYGQRARETAASLLQDGEEGWYAGQIERHQGDPQTFPDISIPDSVKRQASYRAAAALSAAGLYDDASFYADMLLRANRNNRSVALLTARANARASHWNRTSQLMHDYFRTWLQRPVKNAPDDLWTLYYPKPFSQAVTTAARSYQIDALLMYSLMRQESRYDAQARSIVGAIGLFQLMPYTAEEIATSLGMAVPTEQQLTDPQVNAPLAAWHLDDNLNHFNHHRAPTLASYNTDLERVDAWWRAARSEELPEDLFVDTIPYRETRRFVRAVLENYNIYQQLYDSDASR